MKQKKTFIESGTLKHVKNNDEYESWEIYDDNTDRHIDIEKTEMDKEYISLLQNRLRSKYSVK